MYRTWRGRSGPELRAPNDSAGLSNESSPRGNLCYLRRAARALTAAPFPSMPEPSAYATRPKRHQQRPWELHVGDPEPDRRERLVRRDLPIGLAEQARHRLAPQPVERTHLLAPLFDRNRTLVAVRGDDRAVDLMERQDADALDLDGSVARAVLIDQRQLLPDARQATLELPLARDRDRDARAPGQDRRDPLGALAAVALVPEQQERLACGACAGDRERRMQPRALAAPADHLVGGAQ